MDNIVRTIANASIKTLTINWHIKLKEIYYIFVQTTSMIFVRDFLHQKQNFLIYGPFTLINCLNSRNKKVDNEISLKFKKEILHRIYFDLQLVEKTSSPSSVCKRFSFCTVNSFCMTRWVAATPPILFFIFDYQKLNFRASVSKNSDRILHFS